MSIILYIKSVTENHFIYHSNGTWIHTFGILRKFFMFLTIFSTRFSRKMSDSDSSEDSDSGRFKTASTQSTFNNQRRSSPAKTSNIYRRRSRSRSNPRNHRDNNIRDKKDHRDVKKDKPRRRSLEKSRDIKERPKEHHERLDRQKDESGRVKDHQKINKRSRSKSKSRSINSDTKSRSSTSDKKTCHESSFPRQKTERDTNKDSKNSREKEVNELKKTKKPSPAEFREESKKNIDANYGPALPPAIVLKKQSPSTESFVDKSKTPHISKESVSIGPALPPGFKKSPSLEVSELELSEEEPESRIGPIIPCDLQQRINHYSNGRPASRTRHHYEAISSSENDEDFVGPVPSGSTAKSARDLELERRKIEMKLKELDERNRKDEDVVQREEWMTELPKIKMVGNYFGLEFWFSF